MKVARAEAKWVVLHAKGLGRWTYPGDHEGWITEIVEFIDAREDDSPEYSKHPSTQGVDRHGLVVVVCDGRTNFWIWRIILWTRDRVVQRRFRWTITGGRTQPSNIIVVIRIEEVWGIFCVAGRD